MKLERYRERCFHMKEKSMRYARILALLLATGALLPARAWAWDYSPAGQVGGWQQYQDGSFALLLVGAPDLCPNLPDDWSKKRGMVSLSGGFSADGMKAFFASLMEARLAGRTI